MYNGKASAECAGSNDLCVAVFVENATCMTLYGGQLYRQID